MRTIHCSLATLFVAVSALGAAGQDIAAPSDAGGARFVVFLRGAAIGTEQVTVTRTAAGTTVSGSGRIAPPIDAVTRRFEVKYDADWKPIEMTLQGTLRGEVSSLRTTFAGGQATTEVTLGTRTSTATLTLAPDAVVLANDFLSSYEALAGRLANAQPGTTFAAFLPPRTDAPVRLDAILPERIVTTERAITVRRYQLTFINPAGEVPFEVWADESNRMVRLSVPLQAFEVVRDDIASVSSRRESMTRPGDEKARIPATGFVIAATVSKPTAAAAAPTRFPAVVLVGGSGPVDRDEMVAGIPIFGQLAAGLADAGFLVVRYDKRGVGQSGGRAESAGLDDYAEDVRSVVRYLSRRKDVDSKRIALVGHSEGGWVALLASRAEKRVASVVLIATPGTTGGELVLEQQRVALDKLALPAAEKQAKIELQKKIQRAVATGTGWEGVAPELRRQADTPWFQSFLAFDPARVMPKVKVPLLILQGDKDRQVPPDHADRLATLARARKAPAGSRVEVVRMPDINHLLVPATTGEIEEYGKLTDQKVSPQLISTSAAWLDKVMPKNVGR